jgi:prophage tail gpP-like protein
MAASSHVLTVRGGGHVLSDWTGVEVTRALDQAAATWSLSLVSRERTPRVTLPLGEPVVISLGDIPVITGYVEQIAPSVSASGYALSVEGRSRVGDLVDCSAESYLGPGQWSGGTTLAALARAVAAPFGVGVSAGPAATVAVGNVEIEQGETAHALIERVARAHGLFLTDDAAGNLVITPVLPAARVTTPLVLSQDRRQGAVLSADLTRSATERFAEIVVKGQGAGTDEAWGAAVAAVRGAATDPNIRAVRRLVVRADSGVTPTKAARLARWEVARRAGQGTTLTVTVVGWRRAPAALWEPGVLVPVDMPVLGIARDMLVTSVTWSQDTDQTTTRLTLQPPEAWSPSPYPKGADGVGSSGGSGGSGDQWGSLAATQE